MSTVSHEKRRLPSISEACNMIYRRGILLTSDDWALLKKTLLKNCLTNRCQQSVGALDTLFETIDKALKKLPTP